MKMFKNTLAMVLCAVMLFAFAACRNNDSTQESTQQSTTAAAEEEKLQDLEKAGLSLKKLRDANKIESLMESFDSVTVKYETSSADSYICQVFKYDGETAYAEKKGDTVTGFVKGFDFVAQNGTVKAYRDIDELEKGEEFDEDDLITDLFEDKKLALAGETEKEYKLRSLSEDESKKAVRYYYFDKESLALTKVTFENSVGNKEDITVSYNGELEAFAKEITEAFEGKMKTVTVFAEIIEDGTVSSKNVKLSLPASWEYVPSGDGRIDYYMDKEMTQAYVYPGHAVDYTLYISNIFEDEDNGKK